MEIGRPLELDMAHPCRWTTVGIGAHPGDEHGLTLQMDTRDVDGPCKWRWAHPRSGDGPTVEMGQPSEMGPPCRWTWVARDGHGPPIDGHGPSLQMEMGPS